MAEIIGIFPDTGSMDFVRARPHLPLSLIHAFSLAARELDIRIIDLRLERDWRAVLTAELRSEPLFVGLSVMSGPPVGVAHEVSTFIKERSDTPVVWGGDHPTLCARQTLADPAVDMVVVGEGEETVLELARRLADRRPLAGIAGLWLKQGEEIQPGRARPPFALESAPLPPYHLVDVEAYKQGYRGRTTLNLETSRGCVLGCRYCYHTAAGFAPGFRALSAAKTVERILWLRDSFGVDGCYLVDDNFFIERERGLAIAEALAAEGHDFHWQIQGVDVPSMLRFSDPELALLEKSRLSRISVGAESGSPRMLRYIRKPHTAEQIVAANRRWRAIDTNIYYSFLSGFPPETPRDVRQTVDLMFQLIEENPRARVSPVYNFVPYPGTAIWDELVAEHHLTPPARLVDWRELDYDHVCVPYLSADMRRLLDRLYWPTLCMDAKFDDYDLPAWLRACTRLYRPVARARLRRGFDGLPVERFAAGLLTTLLHRTRRHRPAWSL